MRHHQNMPNMSHIRRGEKEAEIIFVKIITKNFLNWIKKKKEETLTYTYKKLKEHQVACLKTKRKFLEEQVKSNSSYNVLS